MKLSDRIIIPLKFKGGRFHVRNGVRFITLLIVLALITAPGCTGKLLKKKKINLAPFSEDLRSDDWKIRRAAVRNISHYKDSDTIPLLIEASQDSHSLVRIEAVRGLGHFHDSSAKRRIMDMAEKEKNANVRWFSIKTLSQYRESTFALVFAKGLKSEDWLIREESIKGLLKIDDFAIRYLSITYILEALNDPNESVVITTLLNVRIKDDKIYARIASLLLKSQEHKLTLRVSALKALRGYRLDRKTRKYIIDLLVHRNRDIRIWAYRVLLDDKRLRDKEKYEE